MNSILLRRLGVFSAMMFLLAAAAQPASATTLAYDSFTRPDASESGAGAAHQATALNANRTGNDAVHPPDWHIGGPADTTYKILSQVLTIATAHTASGNFVWDESQPALADGFVGATFKQTGTTGGGPREWGYLIIRAKHNDMVLPATGRGFDGYAIAINSTDNTFRLYKLNNGTPILLGSAGGFALNTAYRLVIEATGQTIRGYVDGILTFQATDTQWTSGRVAISLDPQFDRVGGEVVVDNFKVATTFAEANDPNPPGGSVLSSITVTPANPTITVGQPQPFTATGTFSDGSTRVLTSGGGAGTWTTKAPMPTARNVPAIAVLNNTIYAMGGHTGSTGGYLATNEAYDPATNTWTTKASMPTPSGAPGGAVVNNKAYVIGGDTNGGIIITTNQEYDPATNTWTTKASMPTERYILAAAAVHNKIYATGGNSYNPFPGGPAGNKVANEEYDPATNTWTVKAPMPTPRIGHVAATVNNKMYIIGGGHTTLTSITLEYDPATNTWTTRAPMPTARSGSAAAVFNNKIYVIGGSGVSGALTTVEIYDPATDTWTTGTPMLTARNSLGAAVVNSVIYAVGGVDDQGRRLTTVEAFSPSGSGDVTWSSSTPSVAPIDQTGLATGVSPGTTTITATSGTISGNTTLTVTGDTTPPVITSTVTPTPNANGWNNTDVTVTWRVEDPESAITSSLGCSDTTLTEETSGTLLTCSATNGAGLSNSASVTVKIDQTAPEAMNQFDPATRDVVVLGRDSLSGVPAGPIAPVSVIPTRWGRGDDDDDEDDERGDADLRTYLVQDAAGNTLRLVEVVKHEGHELKATIVSLQYNAGPIITPTRNTKAFEWGSTKTGSLKELEQQLTLGRGPTKHEVQAKYEAKKDRTTIKQKNLVQTKQVLPGLVLLRFATSAGSLQIEF